MDELAVVQATSNGRVEMSACERVFNQAVWLWAHIFPPVAGRGDKGGPDNGQNIRNSSDRRGVNRHSAADKSLEVDDEDNAHAAADLP